MKKEEFAQQQEVKDPVERALLCALFLDRVAISEVVAIMRPEMFSDPDYGFIYEAFVGMYNRGEQPDLVLVEVEMKKADMPRTLKMGGVSYLSDGMEEIRLEYNAKEYAREIRRRYMLVCLHQLFKQEMAECLQFGADYQQVMEGCEKKLLALREENSEADSLKPLGELAVESIRNQIDRMNRKDDPNRMLTGIVGIDGVSGGFYRKELTVLGGLSSDGKTALSTFIAMNMARKGKHVLHFSFEMTGEQTMSRFFTGYAGVEADRLRIGGLRGSDLDQMKQYALNIRNLPYYFTNASSMTVESLRAEVMLRNKKGECDVVLVDYLHTLAPAPGKGETLESVIRATITALKSIAVEANCVMLVVSQLNREVMKRAEKAFIPQMSDLRDSGAIEYVADGVIIIGRPERFGITTDEKGRSTARMMKLYMLKNRCGATGVAEVYRNDTFTYFTNPGENLHFED